ncbi:MAG: DUF2142 domain-containing protein [Candidatus Moranbacteria bacterium]|nr:DUF2142 domain-containing protein [Candidatus Moranbacteria bacterium]
MKLKLRNFLAKKENLYLTLALFFGLMMAFINPPFAGVPDEHAHYWKAWSIAEGYLYCTGKDEIPLTATVLPDQIKPIKYDGIKEKKIVVAKLKEKLFESDTAEKGVIGGANCPSTPFGYISQAAGLKLGQGTGLSALASFYLARVLTLLLSIALFYWAIKVVPFGKIIFLIVGLLPMTIRQFASLSYDGVAIAFAALFLAYVLKLAMEKEKFLTKKNILFLLILSLFGLNVKLGYFALSFLIFILPMSKFKNKRNYWLTTLGFVAINVAFLLVIRSIFKDIAPPDWTNPAEQMKFILFAPFHFLYAVFDSYYGASGFVPHLEGMIFKVGNGASFESWLYVLTFFGGLIFIKNTDEEVELSFRQRAIMLTVFLMNFTLIYLALYLGWSKVGAEKVSGVQGRYFLAIVPLLIFTFYKAKFSFKFQWIKKNLNLLLVIFVVVIFFFVFKTIYLSQYDKVKHSGNPVYEQYLKNKN